MLYHTVGVSYGVEAQIAADLGRWRPVLTSFVPMFFALSGFLVAGSLERSKTLGVFLGLRALRIAPALVCEVLLSALILGPALTLLPLHDYFSDPQFYQYFLNIFGDIHYQLPGLFLSNPLPQTVNGQLWTVPFELGCYIFLTALAILGVFRNRKLLLFCMVAFYMAEIAKMFFVMMYPVGEPNVVR